MSGQKFSDVQNGNLIDLVKQHPALFNCKSKYYKDQVFRNRIWKEIASTLGRTENDCKTRWKNIRDYYKKKRNEALKEMGTDTLKPDSDFFKKNKHLMFLENTAFAEGRTHGCLVACKVKKEEETDSSIEEVPSDLIRTESIEEDNSKAAVNASGEESAESTNQNNHTKTASQDSHTKSTPRESRAKNITVDRKRQMKSRTRFRFYNKNNLTKVTRRNHERRMAPIKQSPQPYPPQNFPDVDPAISMFFQSIAATVSRFTPQMQARAKAEVMHTVSRLEIQNISEQQQTFRNCEAGIQSGESSSTES